MNEEEKVVWAKEESVTTEELNQEDLDLLDQVSKGEIEDQVVDGNALEKLNMYQNVFGYKYSSRLPEIFHANLFEREEKMVSWYKDVIEDEELSEDAKKVAKGMMVAYNCALFKDVYSGPIMVFFTKSSKNLKKHTKEVRLKRIADDLNSFIIKSGFAFRPDILGAITKFLYAKFSYFIPKENDYIQFYPMILIAKYINRIRVNDYADYWYGLMFMSNMVSFALANNEEINNDEQLVELEKRLVKFLLYIWLKADPETFTGPVELKSNPSVVSVEDDPSAPLPVFNEEKTENPIPVFNENEQSVEV